MFAERGQVRISGQPFEITIAKVYGAIERIRGSGNLTVQAVAASQIVEDERIGRLQFGQLFVHVQTLAVFAALGVMVAKDLQGLDVLAIPMNYSLHEADLDIQFTHLFTRQPSGFGTAFLGHTTYRIVYKWGKQVKFQNAGEIQKIPKLRQNLQIPNSKAGKVLEILAIVWSIEAT